MGFDNLQTNVQQGDTLILYLTINEIHTIKAESKRTNKNGVQIDNVFQTSYGALVCGDLVGKEYGTKVKLSKGFGYILQPTCELWTLTLPHRTQIIYTPDISMIILQLELNPGKIVIESGTGSGSLSHALIRAVKPSGHLHTFDFHEGRVITAIEEFNEHGLQDFVTVKQRDVCEKGFGLDNTADAVFLDLPHPWLAIPHAFNALKSSGGRLCSFSPCIEQVQKSCECLNKLGFDEIETMEVLVTQYNVQSRTLNALDFDYLHVRKDDVEGKSAVTKKTQAFLTSIPKPVQPGHTGYLTFATLPPSWGRSVPAETQ